jgi:methionyl-tRNA formyltransferase
MRIVFVTNPHYPDGLASLRALVENGYGVVAVVTPTQRRKGKGPIGTARSMVRQYGLRGFLEKAAAALGFIVRSRTTPSTKSVERYAKDHRIPVHVPARLDDPAFLPVLADLEPDLLVVSYCSQIFPRKVITLPSTGCLNVHRSLLPKYRGPQPIFWALYHDEAETGATVHWLVEDIDAGGILAQKRVPIHPWDLEADVAARAADAGAEALLEAMARIVSGDRLGRVPDLAKGSYQSRPNATELETYRAKMRVRAARRRERSA